MASLRDIRRRINSVKSTQKITRAMKMVSAARLRRSQQAILKTRPYAYHMRDLIGSVVGCVDRDLHPLLRSASGEGKVGLVVVTSDRGLCGGFNANIVNRALSEIRGTFAGRDVELTVVGRKGAEALRRRPVTIRQEFLGAQDGPVLRVAASIIGDVVDEFRAGDTDEVYCLYNEFKSAVQQDVVLERLLPCEAAVVDVPTDDDDSEAEATHRPLDYLYEPDQEAVLERLLVKNMNIQMHRILFESAASEYGARMTAMDAATRNAGDVISRLTLKYNRARQEAITNELIEVVSGAEAL